MAILNVRNVPDPLYREIGEMAKGERRSLSAQVLLLLEEAVRDHRHRREPVSTLLERIRSRRESIRLPANWPGSLELLREDRRR